MTVTEAQKYRTGQKKPPKPPPKPTTKPYIHLARIDPDGSLGGLQNTPMAALVACRTSPWQLGGLQKHLPSLDLLHRTRVPKHVQRQKAAEKLARQAEARKPGHAKAAAAPQVSSR